MTERRRLLLFVALISVFTLGAVPARANFDDIVRAYMADDMPRA